MTAFLDILTFCGNILPLTLFRFAFLISRDYISCGHILGILTILFFCYLLLLNIAPVTRENICRD